MDTRNFRGSIALQFVKFLAVGALNTVFGYAVFAGLILAGVRPILSLAITYVVGVLFNFVTTGRFVFDHSHLSGLLRFVGAYMVIFGLNVGLYQILSAVGASPLLAQAICVPIVAIFSFFLFKFHVFKPRITRAG